MARIKKIMQSDEEVGKISLATPILISKCLELFMQDLIENSCNITREKNSKTMSTNHLKLCVSTIERFDFLADIVQNIPDIEPEPKRGRPRKSLSGGEGQIDIEKPPSTRGNGSKRGKRGRPPGGGAKGKDKQNKTTESPPPPPVPSELPVPEALSLPSTIISHPLPPMVSNISNISTISNIPSLPPMPLIPSISLSNSSSFNMTSFNASEDNDNEDYDNYDEEDDE